MAEIRAILDQVNLVVNDMEAMAQFYGRLGFRLLPAPPEWGPHHRNVEGAGGAHLDFDSSAFASVWNEGWRPGRSGIVLGVRVATREAVDALYEELSAAGYQGQQAPYDAFWGVRYAVITDPDGNAAGLMSPSDPAFAAPPPGPPLAKTENGAVAQETQVRLHYVPLRCRDLERSRAFYRDVLGLPETTVRPQEFVQLDVGGAQLCVDLEHDDQPTPAAIFTVVDLVGLRKQLDAAGHRVAAEGENWIQVADPDDNILVFEKA